MVTGKPEYPLDLIARDLEMFNFEVLKIEAQKVKKVLKPYLELVRTILGPSVEELRSNPSTSVLNTRFVQHAYEQVEEELRPQSRPNNQGGKRPVETATDSYPVVELYNSFGSMQSVEPLGIAIEKSLADISELCLAEAFGYPGELLDKLSAMKQLPREIRQCFSRITTNVPREQGLVLNQAIVKLFNKSIPFTIPARFSDEYYHLIARTQVWD